MRCRGLTFRDADDAYDYFEQRQIDDEMTPEITFDEAEHAYHLNGARVPSVTEVLKPIVTVGGAQDVREYKRQIGKALDAAITLNEADDLDVGSLDPAMLPFFTAWLQFKIDTQFRVLLNQLVVYSKKLRFAGTLDLLGTRNPGTSTPDELIDCKCVWAMDPATAIQTSGYDLAARESHGIKVKRRGGLQLLRDGTYRYFPYTSANDETVFRSLLNIHAWKALQK